MDIWIPFLTVAAGAAVCSGIFSVVAAAALGEIRQGQRADRGAEVLNAIYNDPDGKGAHPGRLACGSGSWWSEEGWP